LIIYHELDLASVRSAKQGSETLKARIEGERRVEEESGGEKRLDILVGNAAIMFSPLDKLSEDGFERTFAVSCLGHFVFINELLGAAHLKLTQASTQFSASAG
jgi:NAD(P)-dependent dehydrogenase (short-subunit alcohol dehydrogenase family)